VSVRCLGFDWDVVLAGVLCRSSHEEMKHGGDGRFTYVAGIFVAYGLVEVMDQEG